MIIMKHDEISMSRVVKREFYERIITEFKKVPSFFTAGIGELFAEMAGQLTKAQIEEFRKEYPLEFEFVETYC